MKNNLKCTQTGISTKVFFFYTEFSKNVNILFIFHIVYTFAAVPVLFIVLSQKCFNWGIIFLDHDTNINYY